MTAASDLFEVQAVSEHGISIFCGNHRSNFDWTSHFSNSSSCHWGQLEVAGVRSFALTCCHMTCQIAVTKSKAVCFGCHEHEILEHESLVHIQLINAERLVRNGETSQDAVLILVSKKPISNLSVAQRTDVIEKSLRFRAWQQKRRTKQWPSSQQLSHAQIFALVFLCFISSSPCVTSCCLQVVRTVACGASRTEKCSRHAGGQWYQNC